MKTRTPTQTAAEGRGILTACARRRRAAMLLEVVLALAVLLHAIAACGAAVRNSWLTAERAERVSRAMMLTEGIFAQLDLGLLQPEREQTGVFGVEAPDNRWTWKLELLPDDVEPEVLLATLTVFDGPADAPEEQRKTVLVTHALRAKPRAINLKNDFGMTDEQIKMLTDALPGGAQLLDPENFDPSALARLDMDQLTELLPMLMGAMSGAMGGDMGGFDPSRMGEGGFFDPGRAGGSDRSGGGAGRRGDGGRSPDDSGTGDGAMRGRRGGGS